MISNNNSNISDSSSSSNPISTEKTKKKSIFSSIKNPFASKSEAEPYTPPPSLKTKKVIVTAKEVGDEALGSTMTLGQNILMSPLKEKEPKLHKDFHESVAGAKKSIIKYEGVDLKEIKPKEMSHHVGNLKKEYTFLSSHPYLLDKFEERTTFLELSEALAESYIAMGKTEEGFKIRYDTANLLTPSGPLNDIDSQIKNNDSIFPAKLSSVDSHLVKNNTLSVSMRTVQSINNNAQTSPFLHIEGELHHHAREKVNNFIKILEKNPGLVGGDIKMTLSEVDHVYLAKDKNTQIFIEDPLKGFPYGKMYEIKFEGIGTVKVGSNSDVRALYKQIVIDLDPSISPEEAPQKMQQIFSLMGLAPVCTKSREQDVEKIKILQMFRAYYPSEAYKLEHDPSSYKLSVEDLKKRAISLELEYKKNKAEKFPGTTTSKLLEPDMKERFKDLDKMYEQEVYPGQSIWAIDGYADEVRKAGGVALMAGISTTIFSSACDNVASILKNGALSSMDRFSIGVVVRGGTPGADISEGGGQSVFTRMITKELVETAKDEKPKGATLGSMFYSGKIQLFYDLKLLERVGYCYGLDRFGTKKQAVTDMNNCGENEQFGYDNRPSVIALSSFGNFLRPDNEVCVKHRIPPNFVTGVQVGNEADKQALVKVLTEQGVIVDGKIVIGEERTEISTDDFIHVGVSFQHLNKEIKS